MKRSFEDLTGSATPSTQSSPPAGEVCSTFPRKRRSTSPGPQQPLALPPAPGGHAAVASLFTDASGRIARIPTISRKVRACAACKKQKIRCDFEDGEQTCVRCKKMKLECVVNRSLQTILDEDIEFVSYPPACCPMKNPLLRPFCSLNADIVIPVKVEAQDAGRYRAAAACRCGCPCVVEHAAIDFVLPHYATDITAIIL